MSWEVPGTGRDTEKAHNVRAGIMLGKGSPSLKVSVGKFVCRTLGWHEDVHVALEYGTGSDEGWLRIRRVEAGTKIRYSNRSVKEGSLIIKVQRVIPGLVGATVTSRDCKHVVLPSGDLLVKLPGEFWEKYEHKKPYAPKVASRAGFSPASTRSNTGSRPANSEKPKQNGAVHTVQGEN